MSEILNRKYCLNIKSGYMAPVTVHCSLGDYGHTVRLYVFDGSDKLSLDGASVAIHGTRKDGANFGPFICDVSDNAISFKIQQSMTACAGGAIAECSIVKDEEHIGTCNFAILVENAAFPTGLSYDNDPSVYEDILKYVQDVEVKANRIIAYTGNGNAEIVDARYGADGVQYDNLGNAIRTQLSEIKKRMVYFDAEGYLCYRDFI